MKKAGKKTSNAYKMAAPMPEGLVVCDLRKCQWKIGAPVGSGGFGLIYLTQPATTAPVSKNADSVMKIEPHENGPLFCETTFFQRVAKPDQVKDYMKQKSIKFLGVPNVAALGHHMKDGKKYRFMVIQRFQIDLQKIFENNGRRLPDQNVFAIGLQMLDVLEFIHGQGYAHADIKAANIMVGFKSSNQVYLIDYGLAFRFLVDGKHKEYKEDPKKAHDGTAEYASRDAHKGVWPSARGDLEILGYCMWQWLSGSLPWEYKIDDKNYVANQKARYMSDINGMVCPLIRNNISSKGLASYLNAVAKLKYDEKPNYDSLKNIFKSTLTALGCKNAEKLDLTAKTAPSTSEIGKSPLRGKKRSLSVDNSIENDEIVAKKSKKLAAPRNKTPVHVSSTKSPSPVRHPIKSKNKPIASNLNKVTLKEKNALGSIPSSKLLPVYNSNNSNDKESASNNLASSSRGRKVVNYYENDNSDDDDDYFTPKNEEIKKLNLVQKSPKSQVTGSPKRALKKKNVPMVAIGTQTSPGLRGLPRSYKPTKS